MPTTSVIIPAAGAGRRFVATAAAEGKPAAVAPQGKVFAMLAGRPVLAHTLARFAAVEDVVEVVVAVAADRVAWAAKTFGREIAPGRRLVFTAGGQDRTESVERALAATDPRTEIVAIHDAVRPLIRPAVIAEAIRVAAQSGAAVVGRPVDHTVKRVADGRRVVETVPRDRLWLAQTPQVFRRELLARAYAERRRVTAAVTDDAQLIEAMGLAVYMVQGDAANLKITTPEDLGLCEALLASGWPFES